MGLSQPGLMPWACCCRVLGTPTPRRGVVLGCLGDTGLTGRNEGVPGGQHRRRSHVPLALRAASLGRKRSLRLPHLPGQCPGGRGRVATSWGPVTCDGGKGCTLCPQEGVDPWGAGRSRWGGRLLEGRIGLGRGPGMWVAGVWGGGGAPSPAGPTPPRQTLRPTWAGLRSPCRGR